MLQTAMPQKAMPSSDRAGAALAAASTPPTASSPLAASARVRGEAASLQPVVRAVVACVLGERRDHADVEDCTHEVLRRALEGASRLRDGEPLRPWVLGIARHVAVDARRRRRRERPADPPPSADGDEQESWIDRLADPGPAPDDRAATSEEARRIGAALEGLSASQRQAVILFHVEGEGYQRIAERLGVPIGTVATWLSRARRALAEALVEPRALSKVREP
jgi:RNA polymerase sigma-70 factor (ECF subfamily)